jgi:hypothetical protein
MGLIDDFLSMFGAQIERRPTHHTARPATNAETIGAKFVQDALHQQSESFYFHKGQAAPKSGLRKYLERNDWLK